MTAKIILAPFVTLIISLTACMSWTHEDAMRLWVDQINLHFGTGNIDGYFDPRSGVTLQSSQEVRPGVMEYAFEDKKSKWFAPAEEKCRFIVVVNKETRRVIDWRYNGKPDYCTANP